MVHGVLGIAAVVGPGPVDVGLGKLDLHLGHGRIRAQATIEAQDRDALSGQDLLRRAAEDVVTDALIHRQGFAGDIGFVDGGGSGDDSAVGGNIVARADAHDVPGGEICGVDHLLRAVRGQPMGLGGGNAQ